jgi:putative DNA primase/helicase
MAVSIPELQKQRRWVNWKREVVKGKETKVPRMPSGRHAKSNDAATWSTYAECKAVVTNFDGIGIVLGRIEDTPIIGVDFDRCCEAFEGKFTPESRKTVISLDSYGEYSVNGYGAHVLCIADFPEEYRGVNTGKKGDAIVRPGLDFKQIEIKGSGFYFTLSERHLSKTPKELMPRQAQIDALCKSVAGMQTKPGLVVKAGNEDEKFCKLMAGDFSDYNDDKSRADLALCGMLARRHNNNLFAVDEAWLASPLYRDKLDRTDYRSVTILKAIKGGELVFDEDEPMEEDAPPVYILQPLHGRKEGWFPLGELSLMGGASGAGKTHGLLRIAEDARQGRDSFGHHTTASDYCILLHDRSSASMRRTCDAANVAVDDVMSRVIRLSRSQQKERPAAVVEAAIQTRPGVKLWILEGLDFWTPDLHKLDAVGDVLDELQRVAKQYRVAIVGTLGSPKQKENDRYASGRDQFMGSVAFGRKSETCISIENTSDPQVRKMNVMIRNAAKEEFFFTWTDAGLTLTTEPIEQDKKADESSALRRMEGQVFAATPVGEELRYSQKFGPYATFFRWRRVAHAEGKVTQSGKKWYRAYPGGVECVELTQ